MDLFFFFSSHQCSGDRYVISRFARFEASCKAVSSIWLAISALLSEFLMQLCFPQRGSGEIWTGVIWVFYVGAESTGTWLHKSNQDSTCCELHYRRNRASAANTWQNVLHAQHSGKVWVASCFYLWMFFFVCLCCYVKLCSMKRQVHAHFVWAAIMHMSIRHYRPCIYSCQVNLCAVSFRDCDHICSHK